MEEDETIPCDKPSDLKIMIRGERALFFVGGENVFSMTHEQLAVLKGEVEEAFNDITSLEANNDD